MLNQKILFIIFAVILAAVSVSAQSSRIYSISPSQIQAGATAFPLVIRGSNFAKNSVVQVGGVSLDTYFISWNTLRATVPANLAASTGNFSVKVVKIGEGR